jgi:hypothetical protein
MYDQPKVKPPGEATSIRLPLGAPASGWNVARGQLHEDTYLYTGKINGIGDYMPSPAPKMFCSGTLVFQHLLCAIPFVNW